MKRTYTLFALLLFFASIVKAQVVDFNFIKSIVSLDDSAAIQLLLKSGYTPSKDGDYRFIADNKIKAYVSYVKANPAAGVDISYWAFQSRGKKAYSPIFKQIKKGAVVKSGTHFGKPKTEYKSPEGIYYYPFEDSMFDGLYWIYASKQSLLE